MFRNVGIYNSDAGELPKRKHKILLNMPFGWYPSIILVSSSIFQSINFSGFTMPLSPNIVLCTTRLRVFLKRSIQPSEARKPRRAATCRAFSFRWSPSTDALAVRACLNHAEKRFFQWRSLQRSGFSRKRWPTTRVAFINFIPFTHYRV